MFTIFFSLLVPSCFSSFRVPLAISYYLPIIFYITLSLLLSLSPFLQPFLTQLVCNLLDEGNACFRDGDWRQATQQYGEGISVARYAQAEALVIPHELLESLYINRAAAYYQMVRGGCHLQMYMMRCLAAHFYVITAYEN